MRKLTLAALSLGSALTFLACNKEKDYNCVCEFKMSGVTYRTETHTVKAENSSDAGFACSAYETNSNNVDCGIQ